MIWLETAVFAGIVLAAALWVWRRDRRDWQSFVSPRRQALVAAHLVALSLLVQRNISWFSTGTANIGEWIVVAASALSSAAVFRHVPVTAWPRADRWYGYFLVTLVPGMMLATEPGASLTTLTRSAVALFAVAALHCTTLKATNGTELTATNDTELTATNGTELKATNGTELTATNGTELKATNGTELKATNGTTLRAPNLRLVVDWARLIAVLAIAGNLVFAHGRDADLPYASALIIPRLHPNDVGFIGLCLIAFALLPPPGARNQPLVAPGWLPLGWVLVVVDHYRVGLAGIIIVIAAAWPRLTNKMRFALASTWVATVALSEFVFTRLRVVTRNSDDGVQVASFRRPLWDAALEQFARAPIFGRGINSVAEHQIRPTLSVAIPWGQLRQVHNTWLDVAVSGGIVALVAWFGFVVCLVVAARRWWRSGSTLPGVVLACAGLDSLVDPVDRVGWVWLITMTVVVGGEARRTQTNAVGDDAPNG